MKNTFYKKIAILFSFLIFGLSMNSCTYNEATDSFGSTQSIVRYYTIGYYDWIQEGYGYWSCWLNVPEITTNVMNRGAVFVYFRDNNNNWILLPYQTTLENQFGQIFQEEIWAGFGLGIINVECVRTNPVNLTPIIPLNIRIVILQ
jgi:hypothetical protein